MKNNIVNILIKNFPRLKKTKIGKNEDLVKSGIIDSLELMKLIDYLEKKHKFNFNTYQKKNKNFKISSLEKFI
jgi:acyl carrier protein